MRDFGDLHSLIADYASGDFGRQKMALKVISGAYLPSLEPKEIGSGKMKTLVEDILREHGCFVEHGKGGGLYPQSVYAVLNLAKHSGTEEDRRWGASLMFRMLEELGKRAAEDRSYVKHAADAALLSASLAQIVGAAQASRARLAWAN
ncbi:hypothetical protein [Rubrobacter indicoceani]|uniref:hypothetical protein n=1 Tax=Rubrobacter indicoceani TaxID=2051957 RepID=UPI000E5BCE4A|nr:hypothetical protein [Rubrobacter indicoceani]